MFYTLVRMIQFSHLHACFLNVRHLGLTDRTYFDQVGGQAHISTNLFQRLCNVGGRSDFVPLLCRLFAYSNQVKGQFYVEIS